MTSHDYVKCHNVMCRDVSILVESRHVTQKNMSQNTRDTSCNRHMCRDMTSHGVSFFELYLHIIISLFYPLGQSALYPEFLINILKHLDCAKTEKNPLKLTCHI